MRKFLLFAALFCQALVALAADLPAREGLSAFRAPMQAIVQEAAKGRDADLARIAELYKSAEPAWKTFAGQTLDLETYGVAVADQDEVWRQVRMLGLMVGYLDEAVRRGDRTLALRAAALIAAPFEKVVAALGVK